MQHLHKLMDRLGDGEKARNDMVPKNNEQVGPQHTFLNQLFLLLQFQVCNWCAKFNSLEYILYYKGSQKLAYTG